MTARPEEIDRTSVLDPSIPVAEHCRARGVIIREIGDSLASYPPFFPPFCPP